MADEAQVTELQNDVAEPETSEPDYKAMYETLKGDYDSLQEHSRKWEKRAKASNTDNAEIKNNYESEKERADRLEQELSKIKAENSRRSLIQSVATEIGVDAEILSLMTGDNVEVIRANAEKLKGSVGNSYASQAQVKDTGEQKTVTVTKEEIMAIKDGKKRRQAIAENLELFE